MFDAMRGMMATGHVGWTLGGSMILVTVLLILGDVTLFKFIVSR